MYGVGKFDDCEIVNLKSLTSKQKANHMMDKVLVQDSGLKVLWAYVRDHERDTMHILRKSMDLNGLPTPGRNL